MDDMDDILEGGRGREASSAGQILEGLTAPGKPPGRVDKMAAAVIECAHALRLIALSLEEGPLRTNTLETAARAKAYAKAAVYRSGLSPRRRRRPDADDKTAMAIQARDGNEDA